VSFAVTKHALVNTILAQVKVAIIAGATMVMFIWDSMVAVVAVDGV
jgi:hypothetical protein